MVQGTRAKVLGRPVAGKTGTTNDFIDAWFVGYSPTLVAGVWVGIDDREPLGNKEAGGRAALPIWIEFMQQALEQVPFQEFVTPPHIRHGAHPSADRCQRRSRLGIDHPDRSRGGDHPAHGPGQGRAKCERAGGGTPGRRAGAIWVWADTARARSERLQRRVSIDRGNVSRSADTEVRCVKAGLQRS